VRTLFVTMWSCSRMIKDSSNIFHETPNIKGDKIHFSFVSCRIIKYSKNILLKFRTVLYFRCIFMINSNHPIYNWINSNFYFLMNLLNFFFGDVIWQKHVSDNPKLVVNTTLIFLLFNAINYCEYSFSYPTSSLTTGKVITHTQPWFSRRTLCFSRAYFLMIRHLPPPSNT
jgi:hypothetical protein